ncbi:DUF6428 family protein [Planktosalinus lacus]|uniref:Uncharacterized protein n=1 Tax=Planktosalinus lacus TaxID=1526573 RepID=A0A8J2V8B6_9FLAO|nr:DUF6428 family protein [Planktosalinus lacus]GGD81974.1 hypothetical protein GCM10011312_02910 [Planktosalinus lacus]
MKTQEFFELLNTNNGKSLLFEFMPGKFVGANYHITEVKHVTIDSVDCGTGVDFWKETVIQLWESPVEKESKEFMSTNKALSILEKVGDIKQFSFDAELKFEYSNKNFNTAQMFVDAFETIDNQLIFKLANQKTDCKAKEACGIIEPSEATQEACCAPGSGCC